jgi:hypothetical protein
MEPETSQDVAFAVTPEELEQTFSVPAVLSNRVIVLPTPSGLRISFGENTVIGKQPIFRAAVLISMADAISFYKLLQKFTKETEDAIEQTKTSAQQSETNG